MSRILIIHGIANQFIGEMELRAAWYPALCDGLTRAGYAPLPAPDDCYCPFYGDLFRPSATLSLGQDAETEDIESAPAQIAELLEAIWNSAAEHDPAVPTAAAYGETLFRAPRVAELALNALSRSKYLADYLPWRFLGDLNQVMLYLQERELRRRILKRVCEQIKPNTRVVIGHSLGSVVAYEALCETPAAVRAFITLGSPLGIRKVIFDKLTPAPRANGIGHWPGEVKQWSNVAAKGDIVAAQKTLAPLFGTEVEDIGIDSGWDAHSSTRYLNEVTTGRAVGRALTP
jgi:hypothetical protein